MDQASIYQTSNFFVNSWRRCDERRDKHPQQERRVDSIFKSCEGEGATEGREACWVEKKARFFAAKMLSFRNWKKQKIRIDDGRKIKNKSWAYSWRVTRWLKRSKALAWGSSSYNPRRSQKQAESGKRIRPDLRIVAETIQHGCGPQRAVHADESGGRKTGQTEGEGWKIQGWGSEH